MKDSERPVDRHWDRLPSVLKKAYYPVHFPSVTFADMTEESKFNSDVPLTIETSEKPIPHPRQRNFFDALSPRIKSHRVGQISLPQKTAEYMSVDGYSGGHRGSTEDKRRFFEMIANRQQLAQPHSQTDRLLHQKIQMGGSIGLPSDQTTVISGYDSVGGDFAALHRSTTTTEASRHSPTRLVYIPLRSNY
uniref:Zasp-like motif domain-containing protein n=1 Tax=Ascaris lumbricoides TaxID=6252 RepID=A0A0M3IKF6_ASCLU